VNDEANRSDLALNRVEQAYGPRPDDVELARAHVVAAQIGEDEEPVRRRILDFMADHDDVLYRTCLAGHLTGSAMVVDATATRVLLLHHAKLDRWLQPGGHADGDGNLAEVARREAEEETGIDGLQVVTPAVDLDIHAIPRRGDEPEHVHLDVRFLVLAPPAAEVAINHESLGARWARPDDDAIRTSAELSRLAGRSLLVARALVG
jgi:8-oxo-dGTP pyrophosphatase MutT (NUDIX family)